MKGLVIATLVVVIALLFWHGPPAWCRWLSPSFVQTMAGLREVEGAELVEADDFGEFWDARISATLAVGSSTVSFMRLSPESFDAPESLMVHRVGRTLIECVRSSGAHRVGIDILSAHEPRLGDLGIKNVQTAAASLATVYARLQQLPNARPPSGAGCWRRGG
jgi:hypothetical protein